MKKIIILTLISLSVNIVIAQKSMTIGPYYSLGTSTIMSGNSMGMGSSMMNGTGGMSNKLSCGTGIRDDMFFNNHWGMYIQTGFQQRGGMYKQYVDTYKPRYKLDYWDINIGAQYKTKGIMKGHQFIINLGLTQHTLLQANRVYDMGSDNMNGNFGNIDFGLFVGIGGNIPLFDKDLFQLLLFYNQGFSQMYTGNMLMNNMSGRNLLFGIQTAYLIGKPSKK